MRPIEGVQLGVLHFDEVTMAINVLDLVRLFIDIVAVRKRRTTTRFQPAMLQGTLLLTASVVDF